MTRLAIMVLVLGGFFASLTGCTNTIRGLGRDVNSDTIQNYNSRSASDAY